MPLTFLQLRREVRLRKEYLYRKTLEGKDKEIYEQQRQLKRAIEEGKPVPTELRDRAELLLKRIGLEDAEHQGQKEVMDDEYARAGIEDPKVFITTSHDPSAHLRQFVKELRSVIPNSQKMNRGKHQLDELMKACKANGVTDLVIVHEHRGVPDGMIVSHLPFGPTAYFGLVNCVMRHDIADIDKSLPEQYPHLLFHNLSTKLGERATNILKYLFPVPREQSKRVVTFANENDYISFRQHVYKKEGKHVTLKELGPRFELKLYHGQKDERESARTRLDYEADERYKVVLGTLDMKDADVEWVLRPYMNTAKKRSYLAMEEK